MLMGKPLMCCSGKQRVAGKTIELEAFAVFFSFI